MRMERWLVEHGHTIDWLSLYRRWVKMQGWEQPNRRSQLQAMLSMCGLAVEQPSRILDLGCGPGFLCDVFLERFPKAQAIGVDVDPFLLTIAQHVLSGYGDRVFLLREDLRDQKWHAEIDGQFDLAVSATSLHWLSQDHQRELYRVVYGLLRPGGTFMNGDPMFSPSQRIHSRFMAWDEADMAGREETWDDFWPAIQADYSCREELQEMWEQLDAWEGTDDGYTRDFYFEALHNAGFTDVDVFWQAGTRVLYGAIK